MHSMEIVEVEKATVDADLLYGHNLDVPKVGSQVEGGTMRVVGWVLGRSGQVSVVEVAHEGKVLQRAQVEVDRPGVAERFPEAPNATRSGFRATIVPPESREFDLVVQAVLPDESTVKLGTVRAREQVDSEQTQEQPGKQPGAERAQDDGDPGESGSLTTFFRRLFGRGDS